MYLIDNKNLLSGLTYTKNLLEIEELNENEKDEAFESYGRIQILRKKLLDTGELFLVKILYIHI